MYIYIFVIFYALFFFTKMLNQIFLLGGLLSSSEKIKCSFITNFFLFKNKNLCSNIKINLSSIIKTYLLSMCSRQKHLEPEKAALQLYNMLHGLPAQAIWFDTSNLGKKHNWYRHSNRNSPNAKRHNVRCYWLP